MSTAVAVVTLVAVPLLLSETSGGASAVAGRQEVVAPPHEAGDAPTGGTTGSSSDATTSSSSERPGSSEPSSTSPPSRVATGAPVTLAFAGDVHGERGAGRQLAAALPSVRAVLTQADVAVVNLEAAVTDRGVAAQKQFAFRVPPTSLQALRQAGVDVVTLANNHGLDYGIDGLRDTLDASRQYGLPTVGIGLDEDAAYAPHVVEVRGQRIAVLGATQVLDGDLVTAWSAGPRTPGLASAKRERRLLAEVARARSRADTVVVYLHWGRELEPCPLPRQQELAERLVEAGADVIVGGHAHVQLGGGWLDGAYVDYGLGNFVFATKGGEGARSGVLTLTVQGRAVTAAEWTPAHIQDGAPRVLQGEAAVRAREDKAARRACTGLSAAP